MGILPQKRGGFEVGSFFPEPVLFFLPAGEGDPVVSKY